MDIKKILLGKTEEQKQKIITWSIGNCVDLEALSRREIVDAISMQKTFLNSSLSFSGSLADPMPMPAEGSFYENFLKAKKEKIDGLVDMYNSSVASGKYAFDSGGNIYFGYPKKINSVRLEVDNYNFTIPVRFKVTLDYYGKEAESFYIIPFNFSGIYGEFVDLSETDSTLFKASEFNHFYVYKAFYSESTYSIGSRLSFEEGLHYNVVNNKIYFEKENIGVDFVIKYLPSTNAFEFFPKEKVSSIHLEVEGDLLKNTLGLTKKVVLT